MAEALGVAASIITVVDVSAKIGKLCYQYYQEVKAAKDDIARLRKEAAQINDVLTEVKGLLTGPDGAALKSSQKLKAALHECQIQLTEVETRLSTGIQRKEMSRFGWRSLKWPFITGEVNKVIDNLGNCRGTFLLALHADGLYAYRFNVFQGDSC